jgi:hypothetical protein
MPEKEPLPSFGTAEQAAPNGSPIIPELVEPLLDVLLLVDMGVELLVDGAAAPPDDGVLVEPHAASPIGSAAAMATRTAPRRALLVRAFILGSYFPAGC